MRDSLSAVRRSACTVLLRLRLMNSANNNVGASPNHVECSENTYQDNSRKRRHLQIGKREPTLTQ